MLEAGAWKDQPCFVILGGPSLKSLDWDLLKSRRNIIAVNRAFLDVPHADAFFTEDIRFIEHFADQLKDFKGEKMFHALEDVYEKKALEVLPSVRIIRRVRPLGQKFWSKSFEDGLSYSSNSGVGAINIADILGADPIYLLGLDCIQTRQYENYHTDYPKEWDVPTSLLDSFASDFKYWVEPHLRNRKQVINLNTESGVDCWPRWDRDSFLEKGTPVLKGDIDKATDVRFTDHLS